MGESSIILNVPCTITQLSMDADYYDDGAIKTATVLFRIQTDEADYALTPGVAVEQLYSQGIIGASATEYKGQTDHGEHFLWSSQYSYSSKHLTIRSVHATKQAHNVCIAEVTYDSGLKVPGSEAYREEIHIVKDKMYSDQNGRVIGNAPNEEGVTARRGRLIKIVDRVQTALVPHNDGFDSYNDYLFRRNSGAVITPGGIELISDATEDIGALMLADIKFERISAPLIYHQLPTFTATGVEVFIVSYYFEYEPIGGMEDHIYYTHSGLHNLLWFEEDKEAGSIDTGKPRVSELYPRIDLNYLFRLEITKISDAHAGSPGTNRWVGGDV